MPLPPYTFSAAMDHWKLDPAVLAALLLALGLYALGVRAARRRGHAWPWWRTACFAVLGLGIVAVCTMSSLAVYDHTYLWALAAQLTLLMSLAPVGLAVGDPIGLGRQALSDTGRARLERMLRSPLVRVLTFPAVPAVLAVTVTLTVFLSGILGAAVHHTVVLDLLYLLMLVVGCLAALPLLGAEILPSWCTEPVKLLFSFGDGLLDAIPGIVVMTTSLRLAGGYFTHSALGTGYDLGSSRDPNWDVHVAGALMLALTEVVTLPIVLILFYRWATRETARDRTDRLDRTRSVPAQPGDVEEPELLPPWWETEGLGRRNRRAVVGRDG